MTHYTCADCGRRIHRDNINGVRMRHACPECNAVATYERV